MPQCSDYGQGWTGTYPNCQFAPSSPVPEGMSPPGSYFNTGGPGSEFTGTVDYGDELAGSSWETGYEKFFDPYSFAAEERFTTAAGIDIDQLETAWDLKGDQLGEAWSLKSRQLGEGYQEQLGGLFEKAGGGIMSLAESWAGGGQTMSGRKLKQRDLYGREVKRGADKFRLGMKQARGTGALALSQAIAAGDLTLGQATTDVYQALEEDVYDTRQEWMDQQRSTLNVLLGSGIWPDDYDPNANQGSQSGYSAGSKLEGTGRRGEDCPEGTNCGACVAKANGMCVHATSQAPCDPCCCQ